MMGFAVLVTVATATPVAEVFSRVPEYFTVRYGLPDSSQEHEAWRFLNPDGHEFCEVNGRFSVRYHHDRETRVVAVFFRPELALAAVTISRPAGWTAGDVDVLLSGYGGRWRRLAPGRWLSEEGVRAIYHEGVFHLLSPRIVGKMDEQRIARPKS